MASGSCGCSNISIMQLFHQLKQDFPAAPDEVVMQCIRQHAHDKAACERTLQSRCLAAHPFPAAAALMTGARMPLGSPDGPRGPQGPEGPSPERGPAKASVAARGLGNGPGPGPPSPNAPASPASLTARSTATAILQRQPRKLRPAPPPPVASLQAAAPAPPPTPPRLRPAPPPPTSPADPVRRVNGPASEQVVTLLDVNCSVSRGAPPAPPSPASPASPAPQRHTASMAIQPAAPYGVGVVPPRSYTSVNLTLRPPAADQPAIDIHSAGSSLTYSTSSYDPRQGFQSQLQIRIGPGGLGSVSAMRTRAAAPAAAAAAAAAAASPTPSPSLSPRPPPRHRLMSPVVETEERPSTPPRPSWVSREDLEKAVIAMGAMDLAPDMKEHLVRQLERRALLETELQRERTKLGIMQREVAEMERDLQRRTALTRPRGPPALPVMEKVQRLRTEIQTLQEECTRMADEVDAKAPETLPLGETDEEFYKNIYTGPSGSLWPRATQSFTRQPGESSSEPGWTCQTCTFHNHYLLEACETCDVPRIRLGQAATQDIHIRVTHHNFSRRSLHGWVD